MWSFVNYFILTSGKKASTAARLAADGIEYASDDEPFFSDVQSGMHNGLPVEGKLRTEGSAELVEAKLSTEGSEEQVSEEAIIMNGNKLREDEAEPLVKDKPLKKAETSNMTDASDAQADSND